jgi:16S rRNA processing protein RimM
VESGADRAPVVVGKISGLFGVRGWVKVQSYTVPPARILEYRPWLVEQADHWREHSVADGQVHGPGMIVRLEGCSDRDQAVQLVGSRLAIRRRQLPPAPQGSFYWVDLVGLKVETTDRRLLGTVQRLLATGANDVLVVGEREQHLIPFVMGQYVIAVDLDGGRIVVDWDPDF